MAQAADGAARPPPPPSGKSAGKGKGPACPTGLQRTASSQRLEVSEGVKLRPLFWTAVQQVPEESVWAQLEPPAPFDQTLLEKRFALAESRSLQTRRGTGAPDTPRKRLRVLDDRTSQLLAIAFNRLPPPERLASAVLLDDFPDGLHAEALLALNAAVSEQKEAVEQLRHLDVPEAELASQLDLPERYLWVIGTKPACAAKLACGALIVGPARELGDLQLSFKQVRLCCEEFQKSKMVRKCISTSLAIGNVLNRGTSRSGARAIVLPESLQKFDELRGAPASNEAEDAGTDFRAPTLLDFVAQALVDEAASTSRGLKELQMEAEELRARAKAAQSVCLEEAEANCMKVCAAASRARQSLADLPSSNVSRLAERVREICDEADLTAKLVESAKQELRLTQQWSSAKSNTKGSEWFSAWAQFFEQLSRSLSRCRPLEVRRTETIVEERRAEAVRSEVPKADRPLPPMYVEAAPMPALTPRLTPAQKLLSDAAQPSEQKLAAAMPAAQKAAQVPSLFGPSPADLPAGPAENSRPSHPEAQLRLRDANLSEAPAGTESKAPAAPRRSRPMAMDDDVRMEDVAQLLAKAGSQVTRRQPRPQTRVPCLYGFDDKENRF